MSMSAIIHPGMLVGHLLVIAYAGSRHGTGLWECECACGRHILKRTDVLIAALKRGSATGCGRGCGMRKPKRRTQRPMDDHEPVDWAQAIDEHRDLIARYRAPTPRNDT